MLELLERDESFRPTHWSSVDTLRDPYSRQEIDIYLDRLRSRSNGDLLYVRRVVPPRFILTLSTMESAPPRERPGWLMLDSDLRLRPEDPEQLTNLVTMLASSFEVDFGLVDIEFDGPSEARMNGGSHEHFGRFLAHGPSTLYSRTFFGPALTARLDGAEALRKCALTVSMSMLANGTRQVDLLPAPWTRGAVELKDAQIPALRCLQSSGAFEA